MTFVDILAMLYADFCMKFHTTIKQEKYMVPTTLYHQVLLKYIWKWRNYAVSTKTIPIFSIQASSRTKRTVPGLLITGEDNARDTENCREGVLFLKCHNFVIFRHILTKLYFIVYILLLVKITAKICMQCWNVSKSQRVWLLFLFTL